MREMTNLEARALAQLRQQLVDHSDIWSDSDWYRYVRSDAIQMDEERAQAYVQLPEDFRYHCWHVAEGVSVRVHWDSDGLPQPYFVTKIQIVEGVKAEGIEAHFATMEAAEAFCSGFSKAWQQAERKYR